MTSLSIQSGSGLNPPVHNDLERIKKSFCGRAFIWLHEKTYQCFSRIAFCAHKIATFVSNLFSSEEVFLDGREEDLSFRRRQRIQQNYTRGMYGDKVVNFSINPGKKVAPLREGISELKALKSIYGDLFDQIYHAVESERFPIVEENLSLSVLNKGGCFGASVDFIGRYLKDYTENRFEVIHSLSSLFIDGPTPEGEVIQILFSAMDLSDAANILDVDGCVDEDLYCQNIESVYNCLASRYDFYFHVALVLQDEFKINKEAQESLIKYILELPEGVYLTFLEVNSHVNVLIKTAEYGYYIFELGFGTLRFDSEEEFVSEFCKYLCSSFFNDGRSLGVFLILQCLPGSSENTEN